MKRLLNMATELKQYRLQSNEMIHLPGLLAWWKNMFRTDPHRAFWSVAVTYSALPAALIHDLLDGTLAYTVDDKGMVVFAWGEPMKETSAYIPKTDRQEGE